ncbi:MAG TPA: hypothetical protein VN607_02605 [Gemmatimonadaceae bacterium]|nr:hypothetical protein [Gemmatimonadaceae bacterium]
MRKTLWAAAVAALVVPAALVAQQPTTQPAAPSGQCQLVYSARDSSSPPRMSAMKQPSGEFNTFIGGGVIARCPAQNMTLIADSAENYGDQKLLHLIGHVHYVEPRLTLDSELADYYQSDEHLVADGKVHAVLQSGTTLDGPHADYYRVAPNVRTQARMVATGRPTITIIEHDSTGKPAPPATVVANTVTMVGDSLTYASTNVIITRPDVVATGDSADMNSGTEFARLMRHPTIKARGDRPFTLTGDLIDLYGRNHTIERVISRGTAKSVSKDATLTGDTLDFAMSEGRLQRVHAWGKSRAHAFNPTYDMIADSLDVRMPDQRLREIHALRDAYAQSVPDTTKIHTSEHDWLRGDTIYAYFDSSANALNDTSTQPAIERLISFGHARSFYQIASKDTTAIGPSINYVRGDRIQVAFLNREVQTVTIKGQATGVYLDPAKPPADSTKKAKTDTTAVQSPNGTGGPGKRAGRGGTP